LRTRRGSALDARSQREIADEWLRAITVLAHGGHRPPGELLAEIAAVSEPVLAETRPARLREPVHARETDTPLPVGAAARGRRE